MRDLQNIIKRSFEGFSENVYHNHNSNLLNNFLYMDVPVFNDNFELPVFLLKKLFCNNPTDTINSANCFSVCLNYCGVESQYRSTPSMVRDVLSKELNNTRFIKISFGSQEDDYYYGISGAIFNKNFLPVVMMTWQVEKVLQDNADRPFIYKFVQPILRVSPSVFTAKNDPITRHIINQIIPKALDCRCCTPHIFGNPLFSDSTYHNYAIKVDIGNFPFSFRNVCTPSISTTNRQLLDVALNNIDEIME